MFHVKHFVVKFRAIPFYLRNVSRETFFCNTINTPPLSAAIFIHIYVQKERMI